MTRLSNEKSKILQQQAKELQQKGFNNKQIAEKLKITPKTVTAWLKKDTQNKKGLEQIQTKLIQRINTELTKTNSCPIDIFYLLQSLKVCKSP